MNYNRFFEVTLVPLLLLAFTNLSSANPILLNSGFESPGPSYPGGAANQSRGKSCSRAPRYS